MTYAPHASSDRSRRARRVQRFGQIGLVLLLGAVIWQLALTSQRFGIQFVPHQDVYEHILAFAALGFCLGLGADWRRLCLSALMLTAFAFAIEWAQGALTSTREPHLSDALASMSGAGLGLIAAATLCALLRRWKAARA